MRQTHLKALRQKILNSYHCRAVNSHDPYLTEYKYITHRGMAKTKSQSPNSSLTHPN